MRCRDLFCSLSL